MKLGDTYIPYNSTFKLFITTKLTNPHYLPDLLIKVNLIDFIVNMEGLEDQLLSEVVLLERKELEDKRYKLLNQITEDQNTLTMLEDKILI